jgi:hypothetical protein
MLESRRVNGHRKEDERQRRALRMHILIKNGAFPYTPPVQAWLSTQLGKPFTRVTAADVSAFVAASVTPTAK